MIEQWLTLKWLKPVSVVKNQYNHDLKPCSVYTLRRFDFTLFLATPAGLAIINYLALDLLLSPFHKKLIISKKRMLLKQSK